MEEFSRIELSTSEYFFNIRTIDEQHKKFIEILNDLVLLRSENKEISDDRILSVLTEMEEYLKYHFSTEEKYMALAGYIDVDRHIMEHIHYIDKIDEFVQGYKYRNPVLLNNMLAFTKKWFLSHIMQTDAQYVEILKVYFRDHPAADLKNAK